MCKMLNPKPAERIVMEDIMKHPWLNVGLTIPFGPAPHPGTMSEEEINQDILEHMKHCLNVPATNSEIKSCLVNNRAVQSSAIYWLLDFRLKRYIKQHQPKKAKLRKLSLDDGFSETIEEETHLPKTIKRTGSKVCWLHTANHSCLCYYSEEQDKAIKYRKGCDDTSQENKWRERCSNHGERDEAIKHSKRCDNTG